MVYGCVRLKIPDIFEIEALAEKVFADGDRKSTRLNSSHTVISYAVFCLKKKNKRLVSRHAERDGAGCRMRTEWVVHEHVRAHNFQRERSVRPCVRRHFLVVTVVLAERRN